MSDSIGLSLLTPSKGLSEIGTNKPKEEVEDTKKPFVNSIFDGNAGAYTS